MASQFTFQALAASLSCAQNKPTKPPSNGQQQRQKPTTSRRLATAAAVSAALLASQLLPTTTCAGAFDLRITVPEQSSEEAESVVKTHARNLVRVKEFIDTRSWRELQTALRASASNLKQDLYTIIQASPVSRRPELRRLYSDLFDNVTSVRANKQINVSQEYTSAIQHGVLILSCC